jgi:hypothetical protein
MTSSISNVHSDIFQRCGLAVNASSEEIKAKIQEFEREETLLSQGRDKLLKQSQKVGTQIARLVSENGYMDLRVNSPRRFFLRATFQLQAFFSGSSLTERRRLNNLMLAYLNPKHQDLVTKELSEVLRRLSEKRLQLDLLRDITGIG